MSEYPIIFSGPMVRAIIAGRKTQTRRLVKLPNSMFTGDLSRAAPDLIRGVTPGLHVPCADGTTQRLRNPWGWPAPDPIDLWVRETWRTESRFLDDVAPSDLKRDEPVVYEADSLTYDEAGCYGLKRASIHMPRWASRLSLRIANVRVERLQQITEEDVEEEGIAARDFDKREVFARLWGEIHPCVWRWKSNPWVWVVKFKKLEERS